MGALLTSGRIIGVALAAWVTFVWACSAVYVIATFVAARQHVPPRPLARVVRSALKEWCFAALTQPLLIWFQFFGNHMGGGGGEVPVVVVHGYFQNRVDFVYLARRLRRAGAGPIYACNFFWPQRLERSSDDVHAFVARVAQETHAERVDVLTHSSGGLFALDVIRRSPGLVRRAALIALPGRGVMWHGPVVGASGSQLRATSAYQAARDNDASDTPALSIFSVHDNLVHPAATSMISGACAINEAVEDLGHLSMLYDRSVADRVCGFLLDEDEPKGRV